MANIAEDQNSLSDPLYKEFETVCNGIRKDEALKMDILVSLSLKNSLFNSFSRADSKSPR